jgi:osmotically-inducible protein OsmY
MKDAKLRQDIIDEFEFDPSFDGEHIGVLVDKNVVTLSGHVNSYAEKLAAIAAARRVDGVHAIAENIDVRYPYLSKDCGRSNRPASLRSVEMGRSRPE